MSIYFVPYFVLVLKTGSFGCDEQSSCRSSTITAVQTFRVGYRRVARLARRDLNRKPLNAFPFSNRESLNAKHQLPSQLAVGKQTLLWTGKPVSIIIRAVIKMRQHTTQFSHCSFGNSPRAVSHHDEGAVPN